MWILWTNEIELLDFVFRDILYCNSNLAVTHDVYLICSLPTDVFFAWRVSYSRHKYVTCLLPIIMLDML